MELLRRWESFPWPRGFEQHEFVDITNLPQDEYRLLVLLQSQSGRQDNPAELYGMNGMMKSLFPNAVKAIEMLRTRGYFRQQSIAEIVNNATVAELREIAGNIGIQLKGRMKREEILSLVMSHLDHQVVKQYANSHRTLTLSEKGLTMVRSIFEERRQIESIIFNMLLKGQQTDAIKTWANYKLKQQGGSLFDIHFPNALLAFTHAKVDDAHDRALLACYELYGTSPMFFPDEPLSPLLTHARAVAHTNQEIESLRNADVESYKFTGTCDCHTCQACAELDGSVFKVKDAKIGINCPPMHQDCRCFIAPATPGIQIKKSQAGK